MLRKLFSSQLRINMLTGPVFTLFNAVTMMAAYPIYLHFLGYEQYGVWLILATVLSFARLGELGISQAISKLVAEEYAHARIEGVEKCIATSLAILTVSGVICLFVILLFREQIVLAFKLSEGNAKTVLWLLPWIGVLSVYVFSVQSINAVLSGLGRMDLANYAQMAGRIVTVAVACGLLWRGWGVKSLLVGNASSFAVIHLLSVICIKRIHRIQIFRFSHVSKDICRRILIFGGGLMGGTCIRMLGEPLHKLLLSRYVGVSVVPVYEILFKGSMQLRGLIEASFRAFMPEISKIAAQRSAESVRRIRELRIKAFKIIGILGLPLYLSMILFASQFLQLWLRDKFLDTMPYAFRIMLVATFVNLLGVPAYYFLLGMGKVRLVFYATCISWISNIICVLAVMFFRHELSVAWVGICLIVSWLISAAYINVILNRALKGVYANCLDEMADLPDLKPEARETIGVNGVSV